MQNEQSNEEGRKMSESERKNEIIANRKKQKFCQRYKTKHSLPSKATMEGNAVAGRS